MGLTSQLKNENPKYFCPSKKNTSFFIYVKFNLCCYVYSHDNNNTIKKRGPRPQTDQQDNLIEEFTTLIKPKYMMENINNTPSPQISSSSSPERNRPSPGKNRPSPGRNRPSPGINRRAQLASSEAEDR